MGTGKRRGIAFLLAGLAGLTISLIPILGAKAGWFDGKSYSFWVSGSGSMLPMYQEHQRAFGDAPTLLTGTVSGVLVSFSDENTSAGLPSGQAWLKFTITEAGTLPGAVGGIGYLAVWDLTAPPGETLTFPLTSPPSGSMIGPATYTFDDGRPPVQPEVFLYGDEAFGEVWWYPIACGAMLSGATSATFEILVQYPEPATIALLGAGTLGVVGACMRKQRNERLRKGP